MEQAEITATIFAVGFLVGVITNWFFTNKF